jgi:hypothetical protein
MSIPGVGAITATSFTAAIEDPANFRKSRSGGAWLGLTTRRYQSGEVDHDGHISRRGDAHLRGLLYEAATMILTRTQAESALRRLGLQLRPCIWPRSRKPWLQEFMRCLLLDQAGWHVSTRLKVPSSITLLPLPAKALELNPVENIWRCMRVNWISNRVFTSYTDILDHCCDAGDKIVDQPWIIMSIGLRDRANA